MRLTLRTLLAYLDDRLPPANAREIGQKIANSPFTTDLVERIKEVKRRRRLADPGKAQPMIEPNLIAEYLDDQLTPDIVARVEREILSSDAMLAEVAATHEILGMLRDPVAVEPRLRDRLYGLDPSGKIAIVRALNPESSAAGATSEPQPAWKPLTVPKASSKRMPAIIAGALGFIWLLVMISDSNLLGTKTSPSNTEEGAAEGQLADTNAEKGNQPADNGDVAAADNNAGGDLVAANDNPAAVGNPGDEINATPKLAGRQNAETPAAEKPADVTPPENQVVDSTASTEKPMTDVPANTPSEGTPTTSPGETKAITVVNAEPEIPVSYHLQTDSRSLLVRDEDTGRWRTFSTIPGGETVDNTANSVNCGPIMGPNWFGVTERFPLTVTTGSKGYVAELLGPCLVRMQRGSSGGLDLLTGRIKLTSSNSVAWNEEAKPEFKLGIGQTTTSLILGTAETRVALEVTSVMPVLSGSSSGVEDTSNDLADTFLQIDSDLKVELTVLEGSIQLKSTEDGESSEISQNQRAIWTVTDLKDGSAVAIDNGEAVSALPSWYFESAGEPLPEVSKQNQRLLELLANNAEPGDSVLPLMEERNPQYGVLAVQVLSLTRDTDRLLSVLFGMGDESIHRAAIDGLTEIMKSSSAGRKAVRLGVETRIPKAEAEPVVQLLQGLSVTQAADPTVVVDLMAMLESERQVARTLAIYRMEQISKDRRGYHPDADSSRRRDAIRRWQRAIDQNGGKLIP